MNTGLLQEYQIFNYETITESMEGGIKKTYLKGLFQHAGVKNGNGRRYPHRILEREINNNQSKINEKQMVGELDHPDDGKIHLDKVSHVIVEAKMSSDGQVFGKAEVFEGTDEQGGTPMGRILGSLIKRKVKLGVSSRGFGSTQNIDGVNEVQEDFKLITWDMVADPSTPNAYPSAVYESKNYANDDWYKEEKETVSFSEILSENLEN
jgi:hypothetical protein